MVTASSTFSGTLLNFAAHLPKFRLLRSVRALIRRNRAYHQALTELNGMSARDRRELKIGPGDLRRLALAATEEANR